MRQKIQVKCLAVVLVLALSGMGQAETPVVEWIRQFGTAGYNYGKGVSVDSSGNVYVTGITGGHPLEGDAGYTLEHFGDIFLSKYDTSGNTLWTRQLGMTNVDDHIGVSVDDSGNVYVTGRTMDGLSVPPYPYDSTMFLTKCNTDGNILWTKQQLCSLAYDSYCGVSIDVDGNAYVNGYNYSYLFLTKYNTNGNMLWTKQQLRSDINSDSGVSVDGSGNAYITGSTIGGIDGNTNAGGADMFLIKYDTEGIKLWTRQLGTTKVDQGRSVSVDGSGNAYVTGTTRGNLDGNTSAGGTDVFLTKYDTDGDKLWTRQLGTASGDGGWGVSVDSSGNAYVTGYTLGGLDGNINAGGSDMFLAKYDTDGAKLWTQQLGTASDDSGCSVSVDGSGNAYVTGRTEGELGGNTSAGGSDIFLVKISTIPEPGSIVMLAGIGLIGLLYRKRRHI